MRKAGQPRFPPRDQPGPGEGWLQQCPSGSLVALGGEFQKLGFLPLLPGPPAPYPAHAYCRLATFQPMTHKARPRRSHFPLASQNTPVFQLRPVSRKHFLSAYGILLPCICKYSPGSVGLGKNTLT